MELRFPEVETPDDAALEKGRLLFAGETEFLKGVVAMDGLPPADRVEVCFAGRSNVGKSSLINALTGQKALARTSNTPGRTQEINFFTATDALYLVDLPGYGYAKVGKDLRRQWGLELEGYLRHEERLAGVVTLIDIRHGPTHLDLDLQELLRAEEGTEYTLGIERDGAPEEFKLVLRELY